MFRGIVDRYRAYWLIPGMCGTPNPPFSQESITRHTEGRLFARAFPDLAEKLALQILNDEEAPGPDRMYAWFILSVLAPRTSPELEAFLAERAAIPDEDGSYEAHWPLINLAERRLDERCLSICRAQCRHGNSTAFYILSQIVDPASITLLEELKHWDSDLCYPLGAIPGESVRTLRKIETLKSPDWAKRVETILLRWREQENQWEVHWALDVARRRSMPGLREILEKRVHEGRDAGEPNPRSVSYPADFYFDLILDAYAQAGGSIRPNEQEYLRHYGFAGDSEERLLEIQAARAKGRP
jgi:hypothetical protein